MRTFHRITRPLHTLLVAFLMIWGPSAQADETDCAANGTGNAAAPSVERTSGACAPQTLGNWIDALAAAESGGRGWIVHRDRDGRNYYGCLQFRETTFRFFMKKFNLAPNANSADAMNLIYDCALQKRLAARMIRENPENWRHWRKTVERIGLPPESAGAANSTAVPTEHR